MYKILHPAPLSLVVIFSYAPTLIPPPPLQVIIAVPYLVSLLIVIVCVLEGHWFISFCMLLCVYPVFKIKLID